MFRYIFFLFLAMPIIEIFLLIQIGSAIGAWTTIAIVIITAVLGTWMLRQQGMATLNKARGKMSGGQLPAFEMMEGMALGVGGALLLTPGFVTDAIGFACLIPVTRKLLIGFLSRRVNLVSMSAGGAAQSHPDKSQVNQGQANQGQSRPQSGQSPGKKPLSGDVIEGEYTRKD